MTKTMTSIAAILAGGSLALSGVAAAEERLDTFEIDVVLEELSDPSSVDDFEDRLEREARSYCEQNLLMNDRRSISTCIDAVIAAVEEAIEERSNGDVIYASKAPAH